TRISFMNQIARLCETVGADVTHVRKGIGTDRRIGSAFLFPGPGYGGSCFPKDVKALLRTAATKAVSLDVLAAVELANDRQKRVLTRPLIVDGRNLHDPARLARLGFTYDSIGRPLACASS